MCPPNGVHVSSWAASNIQIAVLTAFLHDVLEFLAAVVVLYSTHPPPPTLKAKPWFLCPIKPLATYVGLKTVIFNK
jgi:hypothetical protein